ncbi:hypothetical protein [Cetobacterium sp. SF1]|uniref:hypothetical protein n=1 Tax=Cetobacterium sp. SF1 TaxID=3417654 RepID=UPI003CF0C383
MKKLSIMLGALVALSAVAQGKETVVAPVIVEETVREVVIIKETPKPWLRLKRIGQELEVENKSGSSDIGENVWLYNRVVLETDNWDFEIEAARKWNIDTKAGIEKTNTRTQIDAWRNFQAESFKYSLGGRYRAEKNFDRFQLRGKYALNSGLVSGNLNVHYNSVSGSEDDYYVVEVMPATIKLGPLKVGYWMEHKEGVGGSKEDVTEQQIRAYLDLYKGEKLGVTLENRFTLRKTGKKSDGTSLNGLRAGEYDFGGRNRTYLGAAYKVTPAFEVYGKYAYEFQNAKNTDRDTYLGIAIAGWNYRF